MGIPLSFFLLYELFRNLNFIFSPCRYIFDSGTIEKLLPLVQLFLKVIPYSLELSLVAIVYIAFSRLRLNVSGVLVVDHSFEDQVSHLSNLWKTLNCIQLFPLHLCQIADLMNGCVSLKKLRFEP